MRSPVDVVNIALARLSIDPIASLDEGSDRSEAVRPIWSISLHLFLDESEWSFARTRKTPAQLSVDAEAIRPYRYAYALPEDCIKITEVTGWESRMWRRAQYHHPEYAVSLYEVSSKQAILCNADAIHVEYITNRANLSNFPPDAIDAIACRVAAEVALSMQNSSQRAQEMMQFYEMAVQKAKKNDVKKEPPRCLGGHEYSMARL